MRDYQQAVLKAARRISRDPDPGSRSAGRDNLLSLAVEKCRILGLDVEEAAALIARSIDTRPAEE